MSSKARCGAAGTKVGVGQRGSRLPVTHTQCCGLQRGQEEGQWTGLGWSAGGLLRWGWCGWVGRCAVCTAYLRFMTRRMTPVDAHCINSCVWTENGGVPTGCARSFWKCWRAESADGVVELGTVDWDGETPVHCLHCYGIRHTLFGGRRKKMFLMRLPFGGLGSAAVGTRAISGSACQAFARGYATYMTPVFVAYAWLHF